MNASSIRSSLRNVKKAVSRAIPRGFSSDTSVVQLFVNDADIATEYTFINFPSFFSPRTASSYRYVVALRDGNGKLVGETEVIVPPMGTVNFRPAEHFKTLPDIGMLTVSIRPTNFLSIADKHLGRLTAHFYALYRSRDWSSLGLVHPQSAAGALPVPDFRWASSQWIDPANVRSVDVYQINPGPEPCPTEARLEEVDGAVLERSFAVLPPWGARSVSFALPETQAPFLRIGLHGMPGENGKPLLFFRFNDGSFSVAHS